jgi:hypothetical protein
MLSIATSYNLRPPKEILLVSNRPIVRPSNPVSPRVEGEAGSDFPFEAVSERGFEHAANSNIKRAGMIKYAFLLLFRLFILINIEIENDIINFAKISNLIEAISGLFLKKQCLRFCEFC